MTKCLWCGHKQGYEGFKEEFLKIMHEQSYWTSRCIKKKLGNLKEFPLSLYLKRLSDERILIPIRPRGNNVTTYIVPRSERK
jgi:hypothetical protein